MINTCSKYTGLATNFEYVSPYLVKIVMVKNLEFITITIIEDNPERRKTHLDASNLNLSFGFVICYD